MNKATLKHRRTAIATIALLLGSMGSGADTTAQGRRLFWGQDSNPQQACTVAKNQARRYLDGYPRAELVALGECHCPKPDPGGAPANSLLETADVITPVAWRCMVELRYRFGATD